MVTYDTAEIRIPATEWATWVMDADTEECFTNLQAHLKPRFSSINDRIKTMAWMQPLHCSETALGWKRASHEDKWHSRRIKQQQCNATASYTREKCVNPNYSLALLS